MIDYKCIRCGFEFDKKSNLKRHFLRKEICKPKLGDYNAVQICNHYKNVINIRPSEINDGSDNNCICQHCGKKLSSYKNKWRHENKNCKIKQQLDLEERIMKIVEKKIEKIIANRNLYANNNSGAACNGDHNTINNHSHNTTNITNNNTINIIPLGKENILETLSKKEQIALLKRGYSSLGASVDYIHFNNKYPQFRCIKITNLKDGYAQTFDGKKKRFITVTKEQLLDDLVDYKVVNLYEMYENNKDSLSEQIKSVILDLIEKLNNNEGEFVKGKKIELLLIIYNGSEE